MDSDIILKKIGEAEEKQLPSGVYAIAFNNQLVFVRRFAGRFVPVTAQEQKEIERLLS